MYLSKLAAQMVTLTPPKNLLGKPYEIQNQNFDFCTPQTLILYTRSIFLRGGHLKKMWSKKLFFMKTLSKLGALLVDIKAKCVNIKNAHVKRLCGRCLSEFIDWRYSQSCWYFRPSFVNCCPSNLLSGSTFLTPFPV
jgi:hypothetical protein